MDRQKADIWVDGAEVVVCTLLLLSLMVMVVVVVVLVLLLLLLLVLVLLLLLPLLLFTPTGSILNRFPKAPCTFIVDT